MKQAVRRGLWWGLLLSLAVAVAWAQTTKPPAAAKSKLERLRIAVAPLGWDTNFRIRLEIKYPLQALARRFDLECL